MKKLHTLFLTLFFLPLFSFSQNYWERITTNDTSGVWSVAVAKDGTIYYGTEEGFFFSHDGGLSWDYKYLLSYLTAFDIKFDTDSNLIIAAGHDKICKYFVQEDSIVYLPISGNSDIRVILVDSVYIYGNYGYNTIFRYKRENDEWQVFNLGTGSGYIHAIVKDENGILYTGTTTNSSGGSVFRSVDNGETWEYFGLQNYYIESLAVDSYNRLYAGATGHSSTGEGGFFRYNYELQQWDTLYHNPRVQCLYVNEEDSLFAGLYEYGGNGGAWMSPDYGDTWIKISSGLVTSSINVYDIVGGPNSYLYSVVGEHQALYKTTDSTITKQDNIFSNPRKTIEIFPNPFTDYINMQLSDATCEDISVYLFNILGKEEKIRVEKIENTHYKIHLTGQSGNGFYIIMIQSGERIYFQKIIKY